jgi:hypothetical protein
LNYKDQSSRIPRSLQNSKFPKSTKDLSDLVSRNASHMARNTSGLDLKTAANKTMSSRNLFDQGPKPSTRTNQFRASDYLKPSNLKNTDSSMNHFVRRNVSMPKDLRAEM